MSVDQMSKRVEDAMKLTEEMTALELSSYAKAMRDKFGITAAPVAMAAVVAARRPRWKRRPRST